MKLKFLKAVLFSLPLLLAGQASGAVITWAASAVDTDTSNASQISLDGTLFAAVDINSIFTGSSYMVNGVTFTATNSHVTIGESNQLQNFGIAPGTGTYTYASLLNSGAFVTPLSDSPGHPIVLSGLTNGQTYQLQIWTPYWNTNWVTRYSDQAPTSGSGYTFATGQSPSVNTGFNTGVPASTVISQYILGTFTADPSGTQNIYYFGNSSAAMFGAMQVRAVPEPTTVALLAIGGLALAARRRIRQRKLIA